MRTPRIHTPQPLAEGTTLTISGQAAHHITHVLRLRTGAALILFGEGCEYHAVLGDIRRAEVTIDVGAAAGRMDESSIDVSLLQGIARNDRMDVILQKSVELGVNSIQPLWMQRSQSHLKGERLEKRIQHWRGVIISACEQCGRTTLPELLPPVEYAQRINTQACDGLKLMLQPDSCVTLNDIQPPGGMIHLLVGPEGGLTPDEQTLASSAGFTGVRLGQRILRTETAALAALAGMQILWGDFRIAD
jgi:16S rRNA (uracil1498-N3)-methyltransferase